MQMPASQGVDMLIDIGNTHTSVGFVSGGRVSRNTAFSSMLWESDGALEKLRSLARGERPEDAVFCSVVPRHNTALKDALKSLWEIVPLKLPARTVTGIGVDYPRPGTIGAYRLANATAARHHFGAPVVVVDFGTAVTFDIVNGEGNYAGGIIAPGLSAMTDYLHEKTALLPRVRLGEVRSAIGKSTVEAMKIGAVHGYRGLVRELIRQLEKELGAKRLPVVATGGCATLIAGVMPEITRVEPLLTLEGLRLTGEARRRGEK